MKSIDSALQQLNNCVWEAISCRRDVVTGRKITVPALEPLQDEQLESRFDNSFSVLQHLAQALELASHGELAEIGKGFATVEPQLKWSQNPSYNASNCDPEFLNGYAYAAFSGPDAPIRCAVPRGGIMLMGPDVFYPAHNP